MRKALQIFGWLGTAWSIFVGVLGILAMLGLGVPIELQFCLLVLALLIISIRLITRHRWAAVGLSAYAVYMVADSYQAGLTLWSVAWVAIAATLSTLTVRAWRSLRPGL